jgi:hypothetical protein
MSSAVVSTSAAQGRPFFFDDEAEPEGSCGDSRPRLSGRAQLDRRSPERHPQSWIPSKILPSTVTPASRLEIRPAPEMVSSGIPAIDALTGGLPRGCLTEICGPASSGRTTFLLAALAAATRRGEFCTVVDASDALDPHSAASAGVALDRLLWVRCGEGPPNSSPKSPRGKNGCPISRASFAREACPELVERVGISQAAFKFAPTESQKSERRLEQVLRATDLLLESGGFGLIVLDLADLPPQSARRIPLTTWFRFRRAIEHTPTILLAIEPQPIAGSCSSLLLQLGSENEPAAEQRKNAAHSLPRASRGGGASHGIGMEDDADPEGRKKMNAPEDPNSTEPAHAHLLTGLNINAELIRSRLDRKPAHSARFETKTAWAG